jgi:hypothetical protein
MRRTLTLMLISLSTALFAACASTPGGAPAAPAGETSVENPCAQPSAVKEGESPTCAEGCKWNGTECRQERSIIVHD